VSKRGDLDKGDVQNMSETLRQAKNSGKSPFGMEMMKKIERTGIPELGLGAHLVKKKKPVLISDNGEDDDKTSVDASDGFGKLPPVAEYEEITPTKQKPFSDPLDVQATLRQEYSLAHGMLMQTGKLPITIDKDCLSHMPSGRDAQSLLRAFKVACLTYSPSNVNYREHNLSRVALIGIRRGLLDSVVETL